MRKIYTSTIATFLCISSFAQEFTWVKGDNTAEVPGIYGVQGVSAPGNNPGSRHACAKWTDLSGNLWLFGGEGLDTSSNTCLLNDLWKYSISTNEWTWVRGSNGPDNNGVYGTMGVAAATNEPGAREFMASWTDASGNFWMFGGDGYDASNSSVGRLGDLWKYDPSTNEWTWVNGFNTTDQHGIYGTKGVTAPTNAPGGRARSGVWIDGSGNLWLFGGMGFPETGFSSYLNDLWKYDPNTNEWTWISGSNAVSEHGVYGTISVPSPANIPGARHFPACWTDASDNLYMLGGFGWSTVTSTLSVGYQNDLWKFDPVTNIWTWIHGSSGLTSVGVYGTQGASAPANTPGGRYASAYWKDAFGNFWLFGGRGITSGPGNGTLNDLFRYNPASNEWTWMHGSNTLNQNGNYGTQGVPAMSNFPGGRYYNTWWTDLTGKFWLFGGEGYDHINVPPAIGNMNDMWGYAFPCASNSIVIEPGNIICDGSNISFTVSNGGANTVWYDSPTSNSVIASGPTYSVSALSAVNSQSVYSYYTTDNNCTYGTRAEISVSVQPHPTLTLTALTPTICAGESATLTASGAQDYYWVTISTTISNSVQVVTPLVTTPYPVIGVDNYGCKDTLIVTQVVNPKPNISASALTPTICSGQSGTLTVSGADTYSWITIPASSNSSLQIVSPLSTTHYTVIGFDTNNCTDTVIVTQIVNSCTGIEQIEINKNKYTLFPNPNNGVFTLETDHLLPDSKLIIYNNLGQKVYAEPITNHRSQIQPYLAPGLYYYSIETAYTNTLPGKLVIE